MFLLNRFFIGPISQGPPGMNWYPKEVNTVFITCCFYTIILTTAKNILTITLT